jgi:hypothetical protein
LIQNRVQTLAFAVTAILMIAPAVAGTPLYLSANPPKAQIDSGPSLSLGRVGLDPCPGGLCRTQPHSNLFYFMTKGTHPIEPVPGIVLRIPLGNVPR